MGLLYKIEFNETKTIAKLTFTSNLYQKFKKEIYTKYSINRKERLDDLIKNYQNDNKILTIKEYFIKLSPDSQEHDKNLEKDTTINFVTDFPIEYKGDYSRGNSEEAYYDSLAEYDSLVCMLKDFTINTKLHINALIIFLGIEVLETYIGRLFSINEDDDDMPF